MTASARHPDSLAAALSRQKWVLLGCVVLAVALSYIATYFMPPVYQASARVMVPASHYTVPGIGTEAELVRSGALAEAVIRTLHLDADPEISGQKAGPTGGFLSLSLERPADVSPALIENFQKRLTVQPVAGSYVLVITFSSGNPDKAAQIANALAAEYVRRQTALEEPEAIPTIPAFNLDLFERLSEEKAKLSLRYGPKHPKMIDITRQLVEARAAASVPRAEKRVQGDGAKIVAQALPPSLSHRDVPQWLYGLAPFLGLLLGLLLAGINEQLDQGFKTPRALEAMTTLPVTGAIPMSKDPTLTEAQATLVLQKPSGPTAEAVRALRAALKLHGEKEGRPIKILTVTSSTEELHEVQARTLLGLWLARLAARAGEKVLVIDADLRTPHLHILVGRANTPSLVDYLAGQTYLEQVLWRQDPSGAHFIFGSSVPNTALDLIGSEKMKKLSSYLRQSYDLVIYLSPPCLPSAEAVLLANESDQTIYVVAERYSSRVNVANGLKLFEGFGYNALSLVMTESQQK